ncbi:MAG: hypothetical protein ACJA2C_001162, partial [Marinoscillum sp.]
MKTILILKFLLVFCLLFFGNRLYSQNADTAPPVFESIPSTSNVQDLYSAINLDLNESGTVYYVVLADAANAPTSAEVKAGTASVGGSSILSGSKELGSDPFSGVASLAVLTPVTSYDVYVVAEDVNTNLQTSPTKVDVTTAVASTDFRWTSATRPSAGIVEETVNGVTATVTSSGSNADFGPAGDQYGTTYNLASVNAPVANLTVSFSSAMNLTSLRVMNFSTKDWVFTPTGGSNSVVNSVAPSALGSEVVNLNWIGVTSFTVTESLGATVSFIVDDIIVNPADLSAPTNQDVVYASSSSVSKGASVTIVSSADITNEVWFAPSGTTNFMEGATMTKATDGTSTTILAPSTIGTYKLFVIDAASNVSNESTATLTVEYIAPTLTGFAPASASMGATVTITGTNFNTTASNNIVFFGATKATVSAATATSLTVTVPAGATYGPLTLVDLSVNRNISSNKFFTPTFSPSKGILTSADYSTEQSFSTDQTEPSKIAATGDLDGDGKPDIIIADGSSASKMIILRNTGGNGTASFETALTITTSGWQTSLTVGDIDGDGKLDIVEVKYTNPSLVSVYLNTTTAVGSISFSAATNLITGAAQYTLRNVAISDLDGDGKADIAVVNNSGSVLLYRNIGSVGTVSFAAKVEFAAGTGPQGIMIGDIDSDGLADLAITNADGGGTSVRVLRNTSTSGTFSFVNSGNFTTGGGPYDLALGDLDGDGQLDIATVNHSGQNVSVLLNTSTNGTVSFAIKTDFAIGRNALKIAIGDLTGDGKLDMVITQSGAVLSIFTNTTTTAGSVTFAPMIDIAGTGNSLQAMIVDLDGDGKTDFATGGSKKILVFSNSDPLENADLGALSISETTLSPTFTPSTTAYTATVSNAITSITVTPTQTQSNETATIQVSVNAGSYSGVTSATASGDLALIVGSNTIDVKVTSPDGSTIKNYALTVIREMPVPSYTVSGAGTAAVNGVYTYFGKNSSNKQVWQYGSYYLTSDSYYAWISTATSGGSYGSVYVTSHSGETDPNKWIMGTDWSTSGAAPNPIIDLAASKVSYASSELIENSANDGTVTATTTITHNNYESATFTGTDGENFITSGKAVVTGVPAGLTVVITRNSNLQLTFSLTGNASAHANANDLNNLNITFQDAAFSDNDAANTTNYDTNLGINFIEQINVGSGQTYTTIQSAVNASGNGDVLLLAAETFTEQNITIANKSLTIIGVSPASTIVQAHAVAGSSTDRVFNITNTSYAETNFHSFEKLTIRHGNVAKSNSSDRGGALFASNTTLKLKDCTIESNRVGTTGWGGYGVGGAGVFVELSNFISENCTYYDNHHTSTSRPGDMMGGGAIAFFPNDQVNYMEISNCTFSGNSSGNAGGAIMNRPTVTNDIKITNSTFVGNSAPYGGAYMQMGSGANPQPIFLINSLFYGNTASLGGSQMYSQQATNWTVNNCLIESTSAGLLAGVYIDCIVGVDPLLGALADNGGFTKTYSIGSGSPAINSGTTTSLLLDQRGFSIVGTRDIGAYEYPIPISGNADLSDLSSTAGTLDPIFASGTIAYTTADVSNATTSVTVTPTQSDANATIEVQVNGGDFATVTTGTASGALSLNVGANTIDVKVTAEDGTTIKTYTLTVTRLVPPVITSFSPLTGDVGTTVTITGTDFNTAASNNIVFFGATKATVSAATVTSITVTVPYGATYAPITVLNTGTSLAAYSSANFNPTFSPNTSGVRAIDFDAKLNFATPSAGERWQMANGDIDGDGKPEMLLATWSTNSISLLRNTSTS